MQSRSFSQNHEVTCESSLIIFRNEFGFVALTSQYSDTDEDQPFVLIDHKLAMAYAYISPLQKYAFTTFLSLLPLLDKLGTASNDQITLLLNLTRTILIVNADCYTALNARF